MKKTLSSVLAVMLALAMLGMFAACGGGGGTTTEAPTTEDLFTTEPEIETTTEPEVTSDTEITDEPGTTTETPTGPSAPTDPNATDAPADKFAPPANLNTLGKAEQLAYFNLVANRVREERPGFTKQFSKIISDMKFTGVVSLVQGIIDNVVAGLTGAEDPKTYAKGTDNKGDFLSEITPFKLELGDVASISSSKSGDNWVMVVKIISEKNPAKPTGSANARAYSIASRQEVLDEITGFASVITADVNDSTLNYNSGTINLTINSKGQVISGDYKFLVDAIANNVSISILKTNVTARMTTTCKYYDFKW
ncbi:MAG: hypothetical protein FWE98_04270 [Oscillospiraceae bacterium]|nr:hypothetical protein [Oscillospiraceae bacterium]